jgi:hypothetical protein
LPSHDDARELCLGFLVEAVNPLSNAPGAVGSFVNPVTSSAKVLSCSSSSQGYQQQQQVTFHSPICALLIPKLKSKLVFFCYKNVCGLEGYRQTDGWRA